MRRLFPLFLWLALCMAAPALAQRPVVLVHGIDDTAAVFDPMRAELERHGLRTFALSMTPRGGEAELQVLAEQLAEFVQQRLGDQPFDLVGFSMGGLVSRYYLQRMGGLARVGRFITLSSPHNGTLTAWLCNRPGCQQMRPGSSFLTDLNHDAQVLERVRFTSVYTPSDLMILPPQSSALPVGRTLEIPVPFHGWVVRDARIIRTVLELLRGFSD
ncbi:MAG: alpha/beta fold hydrolase [Meiothermus sp.]|nr:alpha/beta fold hydrolase [Meiothermus sp.]